MRLEPIDDSTQMMVQPGNPYVGTLRLWVPEAICSNTGISSVYPAAAWIGAGGDWEQRVSRDHKEGSATFYRVDESAYESRGVRVPVDNPVEWSTRVSAGEDVLDFTIRLRNLGDSIIHKAGAPICLTFLHTTWWSDETAFVLSHGRLVSLAALEADAETPSDNPAYTKMWGFSRHTVDTPCIVSRNTDGNVCVGIRAEQGYFVHSNRKDKDVPCTDVMLAFGDIAPGGVAEASGRVWIQEGRAREALL